jgi:hypothetical protein
MKKLFLVSVIFLFTAVSTGAMPVNVGYSGAGVPMRAMTRTSSPCSYGHHPARPARPAMPARPAVPVTTSRSYIYYVHPVVRSYHVHRHVKTAAAPSRFDKNNGAAIPTKSFKMNGVTYYN